MGWIKEKIAAARAALSADPLPKRVFWRFVFANFLLIILFAWLAYSAESETPIWSGYGAMMTAISVWLLPIWLFRMRGVSWLRATLSFLLAAIIFIHVSVAAFETGTGAELAADGVDPGTAAWLALSVLAVMLFRGLWQPTEERTTALARIVNGAAAAVLYAVIALWAGTALHPVFQTALNGPLDELKPARIAAAERYLELASKVVAGIPIQAIVIFLALAILAAGAKAIGRSFRLGQRVALALTYASLAMLGLTSYTYIIVVAAPISLERVAAKEGKLLAGYRDRYSTLIHTSVAVNYLTANPRAVQEMKHIFRDVQRACREYNDANGVESEVTDTRYRYYDDEIGEEYQWFNIGTETINCNHREYYSAYFRAMRGSLRIAGGLLDGQVTLDQEDELINTLHDIDRLSATGAESRPGNIAALVSRSQETNTELRAAEYLVENKFGDLATMLVGEENTNRKSGTDHDYFRNARPSVGWFCDLRISRVLASTPPGRDS